MNTALDDEGKQKFVNASFAILTDNLPLMGTFLVEGPDGKIYTPEAMMTYLHTVAHGIASCIKHSLELGYFPSQEHMIKALVQDIELAMKEPGPIWGKDIAFKKIDPNKN